MEGRRRDVLVLQFPTSCGGRDGSFWVCLILTFRISISPPPPPPSSFSSFSSSSSSSSFFLLFFFLLFTTLLNKLQTPDPNSNKPTTQHASQGTSVFIPSEKSPEFQTSHKHRHYLLLEVSYPCQSLRQIIGCYCGQSETIPYPTPEITARHILIFLYLKKSIFHTCPSRECEIKVLGLLLHCISVRAFLTFGVFFSLPDGGDSGYSFRNGISR